MEEKRTDPDDGCAYTFAELSAFYKGKFKKKEIESYWEESCLPAKQPKAKSNAKAKANSKATADGEPKAKAQEKARGQGKAEPQDAVEAKAKAEPKSRAKPKAQGKPKAVDGRPRRAAVVVDPYSSGKYLLIELKRRRIPIICVRSSTKLSMHFLKSHNANQQYFAEMIEFESLEGVPQLVERLQALPYVIAGVFGGSEPGVELAERIADALKLPTANGLELLHARKDKAEMQEALRRNGVPAAEQFKSGDVEKLVEWATARNQWPLVAKPTGGSGSDGIFFCKGLDDVKAAHDGIIGNMNPNGVINSEIALQEFLEGDEYIVDTVSFNGKHVCVAMWVYTKRRGLPWNPAAILSEGNRLIAPEGEKQDQLSSYVFRVLDAVGLKYGPCHTEVMFTPRGPILVEVNARMHGLQGPRLIELSTGISKATYTADAIMFGGDLFHKLYQEGRPGRYLYPVRKQCIQMVLCSPREGYLTNSTKKVIEDMELPSVVEILPAVEEGAFINKSCDLPTSAGSVLMVHESIEQIEADYKKIRDAEESGLLYQVSAEPLPNSPLLTAMRKRSMSSGMDSMVSGRTRLDSFEKIEEVTAAMSEQR